MLKRSEVKSLCSILAAVALVLALLGLVACGGSGKQSQEQPKSQTPAPKTSEGSGQGQASSKEQELAKLIEGAKAEGKVVWGDGLKPEEAEPVIKEFNKKYPFIKVEHTRISGTDSRERLLREMMAKQVTFDVFDIGGEEIPDFKKAGLLKKYDWTKAFPVRPEQLEPDQMMITIGASVKGIGYNTNLVKKEDIPKSWEDLLDPKWKRKIVVDSRPKTFLQLMPVWGEEKVLDYLKKLAANKPQFRRGQTESIQLMAAGEISMIGGTYYHSLKLVKDKGAPIDFALLEPVPVTFEDETIAKGASHPNAAKLLLGWLATEGNKYYDQVTGRGIPLPGFDTGSSKLVSGKKLSLFVDEWIEREAKLSKKAAQAMGLE
ncbi:MAG: extracellular solute-binding protein [Firmicutes bacterium]|nr:extracellular solute-binding protein [Bacillota bacterium]